MRRVRAFSLSIAGLAITAVGLVDYFSSFKTWPKELRSDLRTAIKARNSGDARRSEKYFRKCVRPCLGCSCVQLD